MMTCGFMEMISWIDKELGKDTVLHLSRYYPAYLWKQVLQVPARLKELFDAASKVLSYVYLGNIYIEGCQDTKCRKCGSKLIKRSVYYTETIGLKADGSCIILRRKDCNMPIIRLLSTVLMITVLKNFTYQQYNSDYSPISKK
jgi:hypothetical protein